MTRRERWLEMTLLAAWWGMICPIAAQDVIIRGDIQIIRNGRAQVVMGGAMNPSTPGTTSDAVLKVDPDLESILQKAERYQADGNYSIACQLWQIVLERSGDTLYTLDGQTYFSMIEQVERILANLPEEGLRAYRVTADAAAKQILARADSPDDRQALNEIVRRYFISSVGDDAAFRLASLHLEEFDFVGALRLLQKIRQQHPDPSASLDELLPRIALCQLMVGEVAGAQQTLNELPPRSRTPRTPGGMVGSLVETVASGGETEFGRAQSNAYESFRLAPAVARQWLAGDLYSDWQFVVEPPKDAQSTYRAADGLGRVLEVTPQTLKVAADSVGNLERTQIENWGHQGWRPVATPLVVGDRVICRTAVGVVAWPRTGSDQPIWRSAWMNRYEVDDATRQLQNIQRAFGQRGVTGGRLARENFDSDVAVQLFGDAIHAQMQVIRGVLYVVEGKRLQERVAQPGRQPQAHFNWNSTPRRGRSNYLTAYEVDTGRVLWTLPREEVSTSEVSAEAVQESPWLKGGGVMGPPAAFGPWLIIPVTHGGAIHVYAIDPAQQGRTIWQTYLCDEPESGSEPWSPIQVTLSGSDLFVATGLGVVFVLDPASGAVRFAQRYARQGVVNSSMRQMGLNTGPRYEFDGWSEDIVIPYGREMICFVSDSNKVFSLNRTTGALIWETELNPLGRKIDYILGIHQDVLYAAGKETIIAIDLLGEGRMLWGGEETFGGGRSLGRGLLTPDGILMPVQDSVWLFALEGKNGRAHRLKTAPVSTGTGAPVGNLASDGERLWMQGGWRLYRLSSASP